MDFAWKLMFESCPLKHASLFRNRKPEVAVAIYDLSQASFSITNEVGCIVAALNRQAMGLHYKMIHNPHINF